MCNQEICIYPWILEEDTCSPWMHYVQKDNQKALCPAGTDRTYYEFGYKKDVCRKCYIRNRFRFTMGICNLCKSFFAQTLLTI